MSPASKAVAKTLRGIPKLREANFSYKPQCETCVANTFCMGCSFPACTFCYESRCDTKRDQSENPDCNCEIRCHANTRIQSWLTETQGLYSAGVHLRNYEPLAMPRLLPIVKEWSGPSKVILQGPPRTYVIPVNRLITSKNQPTLAALRLRESFPEGSRLILSFCVQDEWIERIWSGVDRQNNSVIKRTDFWKQPWLKQFDAVLSVNYSVYWNDPQMEIMYAIRRTVVTTGEIDAAGHNVIPLVIWYTAKEAMPQMEMWARQGVDLVAVNMQYVMGAQVASYRHDLLVLRKLALAYPQMRFLLYGVSAPYVIDLARRLIGPDRICIATGFPFLDSLRAPVPYDQKAAIFADHIRNLDQVVRNGADPARHSMRRVFSEAEMEAILGAETWDDPVL